VLGQLIALHIHSCYLLLLLLLLLLTSPSCRMHMTRYWHSSPPKQCQDDCIGAQQYGYEQASRQHACCIT
jgi:hypothetical protein